MDDFRIYYKTTVIEIVQYWQEDRDIDQWKRIEIPEIDPYRYKLSDFLTEVQKQCNGKR